MGMTTKKSRRKRRDSIEKTLLLSSVGFHYLSGQGATLAFGLQDIHATGQARKVDLDVFATFSAETLYLLANSVEEANLLDVFAIDIQHVLDGVRVDAEQTLVPLFDACCDGHFDVKQIGAGSSFKIGRDTEIKCTATADEKRFHHIVIIVGPIDSIR